MGLADQKFSAQSINLRNEVLWYDDLGCLVEYMKSPDWETYGGKDAVSWIGDAATGEWLRVEDAWYVFGVDTPMGYGYAAYKENREGAFDFETTVQRINDGLTMREDFLEKKKMLHHDMN
jgi:copper chaperone NosL